MHLCELVSVSFVSAKVSVHIHLFFFRNCSLFPVGLFSVSDIAYESKFPDLCVFCKKNDIIGFAKSALADIAPTYLIQKLELKSSIVRACVGVLVYVVRIILRRYNWVPLLRLLYLSLYCVCVLVLFSVNSLKTLFRH